MKNVEDDELISELESLIPDKILRVCRALEHFNGHAVTLIDGSIIIGSSYLHSKISSDYDQSENEKKLHCNTARVILLLLHELCYKKMILKSSQGRYFVATPEYHADKTAQEAGRYMECEEGFKCQLTPRINRMTLKLAELLINVKSWSTDFDKILSAIKDIAQSDQEAGIIKDSSFVNSTKMFRREISSFDAPSCGMDRFRLLRVCSCFLNVSNLNRSIVQILKIRKIKRTHLLVS